MGLELIAGDLGEVSTGACLVTPDGLFGKGGKIHSSLIDSVTVVTEENRHRLGRTVGSAAVGAALLGPIGLLGGALFGKKQTLVYMIGLTDGRSILAKSDLKSFEKVAAFTTRR